MRAPPSSYVGVLARIISLGAATDALGVGVPDITWVSGGHVGANGVDVSPDGQLAATISAGDGTLKLWNTADASLIRTINAFYGQGYSVAISPDGQIVAGGSDVVFGLDDATLKLWNSADGSLILNVNPGALYLVWSLAFSPDGSKLAAACGDGHLRVFNVSTGAVIHNLTAHSIQAFTVAWSPDESTLASGGSDNTARLWDAATGDLLHTLTGHTFFVASVAFSPDNSLLATGSWDSTVKLWDVASGAEVGTLPATGESAVYAVAWSPDGQLIAAGGSEATSDAVIRLWDTDTQSLVGTLDGHTSAVFDTGFALDGSFLISSGAEGVARLWDITTRTLLRQLGEVRGPVNAVAFSNAGQFFASGDSISASTPDLLSADAELWDAASGSLMLRFVGHQDVINSVGFSPDDQTFITAAGSPPPDTNDPTVRLWAVASGDQLLVLAGHAGGSTAAAMSPDGTTVASGGRDGLVKTWNVSTGALLHTMIHLGGVTDVSYRPNGEILSAGFSGIIRVWNPDTGALLSTISGGNPFGIESIDISSDGQFVVAAGDAYGDNLKVFHIDTGAMEQEFIGDPDGFLYSAAFSPDGKQVVSTSAFTHRIRFWDVSNGSLLAEFDQETGWGQWIRLPVDVAPDGQSFGYGRGDATLVVAAYPAVPPVVPGDLTGDGMVGPDDLAELLAQWGPCAKGDPCPADIAPVPDGDGMVGPADLAELLANWT
jgi:WD40 repeat protein